MKKQYKSHASSARAGGLSGGFGTQGFGSSQSSVLSYVQELPDYSSLDDAGVVVAFKNLSKKDGTTKAKALEDLQAFLSPQDIGVNDSFMEAWARVFPRLSIDSARRVRQLAYILNGKVCSKAGKRTVKHMPRMAGPWLAGTFDNDRAAAKAAVDALNMVFPTSEKVQGVRKAFQRSILEYCRDAILHETIQTLSDERVVNSEDADATYHRVVATSLSVISSLVTDLPIEDQEKEGETYDEVFSDPKLWETVSSSDAAVRRATHRLMRVCIGKRPGIMQGNIKAISNAYVYKGLHSNQTGSALEFVQTLLVATTAFPGIWTEEYSGKKAAISRFRHFLKQGSQSSSAEFWNTLSALLRTLPTQVLPTAVEDIAEILSAARYGISKKDERLNAPFAWHAYFKLVDLVISSLSGLESEKVLQTGALPIVQQYLFPDLEMTEWTINSPKAASIVSKIATIPKAIPTLASEWPVLGDKLVELAKMSRPEQSKDYDKSQISVSATGERWAWLQKHIWTTEPSPSIPLIQALDSSNTKILEECLYLLVTRNGKPYGAAATIEYLLRTSSDHLLSLEGFCTSYTHFVEHELSSLIFGPSGKYLGQGLLATQLPSNLAPAFTNLLRSIIDADVPVDTKSMALRTIFAHGTPETAALLARDVPEFQRFVIHAISNQSDEANSSLFAELAAVGAVTTDTTDAVLSKLTASLSVDAESKAGLSALDQISRNNQVAVRRFMTTPSVGGDQLLPNLLSLEQSPNDGIAEQAAALSVRLSSSITDSVSDARFAVVLQNLERVSQMSMPMNALHDLTMRLLGPEQEITEPSNILPSLELWQSALLAVLNPPAPSLALMSVLGGAVHLVGPSKLSSRSNIQYDADGFSQALRIAMHVSKLLSETKIVDTLGHSKAATLALLQLSVLVAEDSVSVVGSTGIWRGDTAADGEVAILDFMSEANGVLGSYWKLLQPNFDDDPSTELSLFFSALEGFRAGEQDTSPLSYYIGVCSARVYANLFEIYGFSTSQVQKCENTVKVQRSENRDLDLTSSIAGFHQPLAGTPTLTRLFNEMVAQLTDLSIEKDELNGFRQLVFLNQILRTQDDVLSGIPRQRLIFLVKQLLVQLRSPVDTAIRSEVLRALATVFPSIDDMYGEHWEQALGGILEIWTSIVAESEVGTINEGHILLENTSLRLLAVLRRLARADEANDDLVDALKEKSSAIQEGFINLLTAANGISDESHQPLRITHELLARQITATSFNKLGNLGELYPMVYAPSRSIQQAAFELLHKEIPVAQEKISFDAAIDNKTAQLPDELLSLILEAPTLDSLADASFQGAMPLPLQGYLYSWRLIFDHFQGSSYKVKSDYSEQLKDGTYLSGLLNLAFDFLGHTNGRPVDASRFSAREYTPDDEPSPEKDVQWLLTHLYYLALTHLPGLVRSYYLEIRSRQLPQVIENWTAKYISPLIIEASLKDVLEWAGKPKEDPEFENVTFKVGFRSREITTSYEVDEQIMSMKIVLPEAYPLASAQVLGINRVAVNEEKWQSWLRNCRGVIAFSNGSLIDGLTAWRRNATGAMKGQTECAICYSIVSADKKIPNKKCPTCKHMFHSSCLAKWFKTSNASTCPLCRNTFSFA